MRNAHETYDYLSTRYGPSKYTGHLEYQGRKIWEDLSFPEPVKINKLDMCFIVHIADPESNPNNAVNPKVPLLPQLKSELQEIAQTIKKRKVKLSTFHIVGLSHAGLIPVARRLGFSYVPIDTSQDLEGNIIRAASGSTSREMQGLDSAPAFMFYFSGPDFIKRYGKRQEAKL